MSTLRVDTRENTRIIHYSFWARDQRMWFYLKMVCFPLNLVISTTFGVFSTTFGPHRLKLGLIVVPKPVRLTVLHLDVYETEPF